MLYTTAMQLVGFPEKAGVAGTSCIRSAATSFPTVSKDGKTYTFHIRPGMKFSDGSPVTAAAYQRAFERTLSPKMGSPIGCQHPSAEHELVGGDAFLNGKSDHISGITAKGMVLSVKLTKPNATFVSQHGHAVVHGDQAEHAVLEPGPERVSRRPARTTSRAAIRAAARC